MSKAPKTIKPKERDTIIQALSAGVVPRVGLPYIQVARASEIGALLRDIDRIADGGAAVRFVIGEYGAGKTFFANLIRLIALERKCVTVHADLAPDRGIHASAGQAGGLYSEAIRNMSTRTKPEGGALAAVVERLVTDAVKEASEAATPHPAIGRQRPAMLRSLRRYGERVCAHGKSETPPFPAGFCYFPGLSRRSYGVRRHFGVICGALWPNPAILCERFHRRRHCGMICSALHRRYRIFDRSRFDSALFHITAAHIPSMMTIAAGRSPGARYVPPADSDRAAAQSVKNLNEIVSRFDSNAHLE